MEEDVANDEEYDSVPSRIAIEANPLILKNDPSLNENEYEVLSNRDAKQLGGTTKESGVVEEFQLETDSIGDADDLKSNEFIEIVYFV